MVRSIVVTGATLLGFARAAQYQLTSAGLAREQQLERSWSEDLAEAGKKNPIKRVIDMLTDMKKQLENEADHEAEMYDQMVCWCETNEKEKVKAIADAEAKDKDLSSEIEARSARFGSVSTEIDAMKSQISEDTEALKTATAIREREAADFRENEKELVQAITNLKNAINVLKKHGSAAAFVQVDAPVMTSLRTVLRDVSLKYELMMAGENKPAIAALLQMSTAEASGISGDVLHALNTNVQMSDALPVEFAQRVLERHIGQASGAGFLQEKQPAGAGESYSPASGPVFAILDQMLEEFEKNLSVAQGDEVKAKDDNVALSAAKEKSIDSGKEKLDAMQAEDAGNAKALSDAKEDLELTRKQRTADVEFLKNLRLTCQNLDREWEQRSKTRSQEIAAVSEALAIITSDDNQEMLYKSTSFLQETLQEGAEMRARRVRAMEYLRQRANEPDFDADDLLSAWHNRRVPAVATGPRARLSTLAITVSLDSFTKVKEAMDKMVADIKAQSEEEVKLKAFCTKEFNQNEKETYENTEHKKDLEAKMEELAALIEQLQGEIAGAQQQISETELGIKKASQQREGENAEYQTTIADQRATQAILSKALKRLKDFYKEKGGAFVEEVQGQTPPVQFAKQKNNANASPVIGMIAQIIEDSKATETSAISTEKEAQSNYETFVKDSNNLIKELTDATIEKTKAISESQAESEDAKADHTATLDELDMLAQHNAELHGQCDFVLQNFDIRQKARTQEIEAIGQAKAILSGAK